MVLSSLTSNSPSMSCDVKKVDNESIIFVNSTTNIPHSGSSEVTGYVDLVEGALSVFRSCEIKVSFELAHEVALFVVTYLCHNLLDTQEGGC